MNKRQEVKSKRRKAEITSRLDYNYYNNCRRPFNCGCANLSEPETNW